jgi:dipeptide/tripeptide permease
VPPVHRPTAKDPEPVLISASQFANAAGIDNTYVYQIILSSVNVVMSFPGLLAVDRLGRRDVLLWGAVIMFSGQIITGARESPGEEAFSPAGPDKVCYSFHCST